MALFRIRYIEVTVSYMGVESDSKAEAEEFLEIEREYDRGYIRSLLSADVIDKKIEPISWDDSGSALTCHDGVKAWLEAYEKGSLGVRTYCKL